ncbi:MAG: bifunctional ADP-dependent NAD(P)H-hydrate dehydratase/NAD(P)H-hydrate epimerase [Bifidobacteriaceae bacterium]|jgi:hydroxyethylthiazole kinase-like uncharacterized protein yjeF|nr:bifunctional ADP-dependent NAD(P)H-hydrate dehydratase/NAD(P)H-hydrate epimerase [Bifidobacteriaceae bacterium]
MISSYTASQIHDAEVKLLASGPPERLMEKAAMGAATVILRELRLRRGQAAGSQILMLVGTGNNGGDALHAGALLVRRGVAVTAVAASNRVHPAGRRAFEGAGGRLRTLVEGGPGVWTPIEQVANAARASDGIVDALLGIGAHGALSGHSAGLVTTLTVEAGLSAPLRYRKPGRPMVFAIDVPSGIGVDDGTVDGPVLPADVTITFGGYKPGALLPPASGLFGRIELVEIGLDAPLRETDQQPAARSIEDDDVIHLWPVPRRGDHKYTRGVLGVVAGSETYPGAAVLTTSAAAAAGVGMVRYLGPDRAVERVLSRRPEVVPGGGRVDAWALGPGVAPGAEDQLERMRRALKWARSERVPTVIDAGGFTELPHERLDPWIVLTPHAGELATLLGDRGVPVERSAIEQSPARYARMAADMLGGTVLLKGPATVVAGQSNAVYVQADGTPWLATAGTGDVLTGLIGVLLAGHGPSVAISPDLPVQLAAVAALVHGRAAVRASGHEQVGGRTQGAIGSPICALDVIQELPATIAELLAR